ncbi:DUF5819 family protein [Kitasatospora sp. DSM 101779]|uniref:DUF5819 family protein n=1 Tax=Kitasatospora sp. DSM 101779 TaxID=2853165 RepID=UPI0021D9F65A|nr:DUF5819 family protein [Kitasatospora sp. DSM 101779]MCU7820142.1 hypothetical protein [Kitasatospora sp. DSM 101779]
MTTPGIDLTRPTLGQKACTAAVLGGLAAWFGATFVSQHPQMAFDRVRAYDKIGLLVPNWRFFAPEPARHDYHVLHRVLTADGEETPWTQTTQITPRTWTHTVWFPSRRREKAVFDLAFDLIALMGQPGADVTAHPAYWTLVDMVTQAVRAEYGDRALPQGFQFLVARHTGYEQEPEPEYIFVSAFVLLPTPVGSTDPATRAS